MGGIYGQADLTGTLILVSVEGGAEGNTAIQQTDSAMFTPSYTRRIREYGETERRGL